MYERGGSFPKKNALWLVVLVLFCRGARFHGHVLLSQVQENDTGIFDSGFDLFEERHCFPSIDEPVIIRQCDIHHGTNLDLAMDGNWSIKDRMHPQNRRLGWINDRCPKHGSKDTTITDGESTSIHILDRQ